MSLDYGLVKQFANITNDSTPEKTDPDILIGTIQANGDVLLDGATSPTPAGTSTANYKTGDRVTCIIENHECKVIGNATAPSVQRAEDLADGSINSDKIAEYVIPHAYSGTGEPTEEATEGDVYFDAAAGNSMYIYTTNGWEPKILTGEAIIAPTGSKVYYTATQPTDAKDGDTWFKKLADGSYEQYEYSNNQWTAAELSGTSIKARSITANEIAAGAITANEISSNYVYGGYLFGSQIIGGLISGCTFSTVGSGLESGIYKATNDGSIYKYEAILTPNGLDVTRRSVSTSAQVFKSRYRTEGIDLIGYPTNNTLKIGATIPSSGGYSSLKPIIEIYDGGSEVFHAGYDDLRWGGTSVSLDGHTHSGVYAAYSHAHYNDTLYCTTLGSTNYKCRVILDPASISSSNFTDCGYSKNTFALGYQSSSRRYKHDIQDVDPALFSIESLYDLPVRQFKYKEGVFSDDENYDYNTIELGFIAEEVSDKFPFGCYYKDDVPEAWTSKNFTPALLYLIQKQKKQIDSLEERLAKLEKALND